MPDLTLYFDCDPGADPKNLERDLQQGLQQLGNVKAAKTSTPATRFTGLEILAALTLTVQIVHEARSIVEELKVLFARVRGSRREASGTAGSRPRWPGKESD